MAPDQVTTVESLVRDVLPDSVLGRYLHGSSILGTLRPTSDLDLFAVTDRRTTDDERRELIARPLPISGRGDSGGRSRSVELGIVAQPEIRPWSCPGLAEVPDLPAECPVALDDSPLDRGVEVARCHGGIQPGTAYRPLNHVGRD